MCTFDEAVSEHNDFLIRKAKYFENKYSPRINSDDIKQMVLMGFWEAWQKYDPQLGAKLTTFAYGIIYGRVIDLVKNELQWDEPREDVAEFGIVDYEPEIELPEKKVDKKNCSLGDIGRFEIGRLVKGIFVSTGERSDDIELVGPRLDYLNDRSWKVGYVVRIN